MDRSIAPKVKLPKFLTFPVWDTHTLPNHIPMYIMPSQEETIQFVILYKGGRIFEKVKCNAALSAAGWKKGTNTKNAYTIADNIAFYGASISIKANMYTAKISVMCLQKQLNDILALLQDIILNATYPKDEMDKIKIASKQKIQRQKEKINYLAAKQFNAAIYGKNHPFGYSINSDLIDKVKMEDIIHHYKNHFQFKNSTFVAITANLSKDDLQLFNIYLGDLPVLDSPIPTNASTQAELKKNYTINHKNGLQAAIYIGSPFVSIHHEDYMKMKVLNTIFGGYFSSRLMSNIRENKGYTYGIYSSLIPILDTSCICISTQVGKKYKTQTINEIEKEIIRLKDEMVPEKELHLVKNYMIGQLMDTIDGPAKSLNTLVNTLVFNLPQNYFELQLSLIHTISATELRDLAIKYFDFKNMYKIIAS